MRTITAYLSLSLLCAAAACEQSVAGEYALVSVNGEEVPYADAGGFFGVTVLSGSLVLTGDQTFSGELDFQVDENATVTFSGTFSLEPGGAITFAVDESAGGDKPMVADWRDGMWDGDRITLLAPSGLSAIDTLVFRRAGG